MSVNSCLREPTHKEQCMTEIRKDDSVAEEASALGQRAKGAAKDVYGTVTGDRQVEIEGERDKAMGKARQETNDVLDETDGVRGATVGGRNLVTGLYDTPDAAHRAYNDLTTRHGYKPNEVSVLMSDESRRRHFGDVAPGKEFSHGTKAAEGAGVGGGIGMGIGAALGALLAVGTTIALPGLGLVVAGPLAAALAGAGAGGATGGLIGALVGAGIPEDRAREYERGINNGGIVIGTHARDERHAADLQRDYQSWGATNVRI
jgi:uncharacterized protein YjbJ (UPF0337 family)